MALFNRKKKNAQALSKGEAPKESQLKVLKDAFKVTQQHRPMTLLWCLLIFAVAYVIGILIGVQLGHPVYFAIIFFPLAFLFAFLFFTREANRAAYQSIENEVGAAASVIMAIRRGYTTTPAVAATQNQDMVHRSVGRPGIVLVAEGGNGAKRLLADEKKKMERFVPGVPITEILVGDGEGQVPLRKLQRTMRKLPKTLTANQMREVRVRIKAIGGLNMPIPKGPMPKSFKPPRR